MTAAATAEDDEVPEWIEGFLDGVAAFDDEQLAEAEDDAAARLGRIQAELADTWQEIALLKRMEAWAARYETMPDAKARELITYLKGVCLPDGEHWTNERVVVFTEYRDTQIWLKARAAAPNSPSTFAWPPPGWTRRPRLLHSRLSVSDVAGIGATRRDRDDT